MFGVELPEVETSLLATKNRSGRGLGGLRQGFELALKFPDLLLEVLDAADQL